MNQTWRWFISFVWFVHITSDGWTDSQEKHCFAKMWGGFSVFDLFWFADRRWMLRSLSWSVVSRARAYCPTRSACKTSSTRCGTTSKCYPFLLQKVFDGFWNTVVEMICQKDIYQEFQLTIPSMLRWTWNFIGQGNWISRAYLKHVSNCLDESDKLKPDCTMVSFMFLLRCVFFCNYRLAQGVL